MTPFDIQQASFRTGLQEPWKRSSLRIFHSAFHSALQRNFFWVCEVDENVWNDMMDEMDD
jgi:hypothetical protein